jgi:hypothetical protein
MVSFSVGNIRQSPEIWIMQTVLRTRRNVTTEEFARAYKYKDPDDALTVLNTLHKNRRIKRIITQSGTIEWDYI